MSAVPSTGEVTLTMALLERLYAPLVKKLNLTSEQSRKFYEVILDDKMKRQAQVADLLRHEDFSRLAKAIVDIQKETDTSLQALLGAANFAKYQEHQPGLKDRGMLELMKSDFAESPLTEEQQQHLLKALESGRKVVGNSTSGSVVEFSIADTSDVTNEKLSRQESIDHHVLQQAAGFLSPVQLQILGSAQARMMTARKDGYAKARAMFGEHGSILHGYVLFYWHLNRVYGPCPSVVKILFPVSPRARKPLKK